MFSRLASPLLLVAALTASLAADERPLRWAADCEGGAPYIFKDPANIDRNIGFEVEIAEALSQELARKIEFVQYAFRSLTPGLQRGDFDFAMNGVEITPDRLQAVRFSRPYYIYKQQLVVRADEPRLKALEDCQQSGVVVGTLDDTAAARLLDRMGIAKKIYDNQTEPYLDLGLRRIDAVLLDLPIAAYYALPDKKLKYAGPPVEPGYYAIMFRKEDEELAAEVDAALGRLIDSGKLRAIYDKWNLWTDDQERLANLTSLRDVAGESARQWPVKAYLPTLLSGAWVTIQLSFAGMALAILLGLPIAMMRLYGPWPLRALATGYVEFFRGIPVLLLLFFIYYGLPSLFAETAWSDWFRFGPMTAAILGFGLNYASYEAEIYRAGISSIPVGQWEAAASLGMSRTHTFHRIILPQAIRFILPPMTNDFVALFKDTSVVSILAVAELTKQYDILARSSTKYLEIGAMTAALYLIMSVPLGLASRALERRWGKGHL